MLKISRGCNGMFLHWIKTRLKARRVLSKGALWAASACKKIEARMLRPLRQQVALAKIASIAWHDVDHCQISHGKQRQKEQ